MDSDQYWILAKPEGDAIAWTVIDTPDGKEAIGFFTSREKAKRFFDATHPGPGWGIAQMMRDEFLTWVRANVKSGKSYIMIDPEPNDATLTDIHEFLLGMEKKV